MKRYVFIPFFILFFIVGCNDKTEQQPQEILQETIRIYNGLLADGYRRQDMNHLIQAATQKRATKVFYHMAALGEGGVKMDSALVDLKVVATKPPSPDKAEITCKERWQYKYINIDNGNSSPLLTINYTARYQLLKEKQRWLVDNITILYTDRTSDEEQLSFFKRPDDRPQGSVPANGSIEPIIQHPQKPSRR